MASNDCVRCETTFINNCLSQRTSSNNYHVVDQDPSRETTWDQKNSREATMGSITSNREESLNIFYWQQIAPIMDMEYVQSATLKNAARIIHHPSPIPSHTTISYLACHSNIIVPYLELPLGNFLRSMDELSTA